MTTASAMTVCSANFVGVVGLDDGTNPGNPLPVRVTIVVPPALIQAAQGLTQTAKLYVLGHRMDAQCYCPGPFTEQSGIGVVVKYNGLANALIQNLPQMNNTYPQTGPDFSTQGPAHIDQVTGGVFQNVQEAWVDDFRFPEPALISSPGDFSVTAKDYLGFNNLNAVGATFYISLDVFFSLKVVPNPS